MTTFSQSLFAYLSDRAESDHGWEIPVERTVNARAGKDSITASSTITVGGTINTGIGDCRADVRDD
ncbi:MULTISPECIES: hypothetical protein [Synechococcales]|uniref:hypothetical protein n=1 Tax=Synechococcus sp. CS-1333 TaxID=2848638 RepID=UPI00223A9FCE|nr:hypothetical protein [Synechococcus sp. CS-1333]MCT0210433.1 hypothetical protein [Synechococcus sp. CS-1333]